MNDTVMYADKKRQYNTHKAKGRTTQVKSEQPLCLRHLRLGKYIAQSHSLWTEAFHIQYEEIDINLQ